MREEEIEGEIEGETEGEIEEREEGRVNGGKWNTGSVTPLASSHNIRRL
jgi:hypothetical protein